jgi:hypothetical protein
MKWSVLPAAMLVAATLSLAQDQPSEVAQRKEAQQDRIAQGVKSGQLTAGETANLENKEAPINGETRADRAAHGGKTDARRKGACQPPTESPFEPDL